MPRNEKEPWQFMDELESLIAVLGPARKSTCGWGRAYTWDLDEPRVRISASYYRALGGLELESMQRRGEKSAPEEFQVSIHHMVKRWIPKPPPPEEPLYFIYATWPKLNQTLSAQKKQHPGVTFQKQENGTVVCQLAYPNGRRLSLTVEDREFGNVVGVKDNDFAKLGGFRLDDWRSELSWQALDSIEPIIIALGLPQKTREKTSYGMHCTYKWVFKDLTYKHTFPITLEYVRYDTGRPKAVVVAEELTASVEMNDTP
jgi:hypothetical protein